jgi:hypothetical protein
MANYPQPPPSAKIFAGVVTAETELLPDIRARLESEFGPVDIESPVLPFELGQTYYGPEMGAGLRKKFYGFARPAVETDVADAKIKTVVLEDLWRRTDGTRRVNLDPGCVSAAKVILPTTKNYTHRIYLKDGIFAEVTLGFVRGKWEFYPYTYPDFKTKEYLDFFSKMRKMLMSST